MSEGDHRKRTVEADGVDLAVREYGRAGRPTVVLVHGYPDTQAIWEPVARLLADAYHVVTYDVRGAGDSTRPRPTKAYVMENLSADLLAVADAVSPDRPVHLVGHDWGSVQGWGAVTGGALTGRIASFTSISGPCIEHFGQWVRDRLRRPTPRNLRQLLGQFARSWYLLGGAIPGVGRLVWTLGGVRLFPAIIERVERVERRPAPTFRRDAVHGMKLYKANGLRLLRPGRTARTDVPVQVIAPTRDLFVSPEQSKDLARYTGRLWRRELRAGHWGSISARADVVATAVAELVDHIEGDAESAALAQATVTVLPGGEANRRRT
ncbi:alpha/beta fold hydrolase [Thermomonospora umbrina]|uniref:Pimeloyl-ACP methyl ester carboxylesterase n=1 Tax=Thermomonospora umbrina TaxID=111806 RepID=A0A3D9T1Y7_9ACTN|nr:alpha/beta fold hydrolase [Thermomonospora umbrina]REF00861.1 pimeloyl-ACP methyl ester carboxylesterase [Thermomonospora umbrina]